MAKMGKLLQWWRKQNNLTQTELAVRMGEMGYPIKGGAISSWEKDNSVPNANQFLALCQILGITDIWGEFVGHPNRIPLRLEAVSAGSGEYVGDVAYEWLETDVGDADYALRIAGDSMEPLVGDGEIVLVAKTEILGNGDVGIFYLDGEQYCKRLVGNRLVSENKKYGDIDISNSDCFRILGKVVGIHGKQMDN